MSVERLTKRYNGLIDIGDEGNVEKCMSRLAAYEDALVNPDGTVLEPQEAKKMLDTAMVESCKDKAKIDLLQSENAALKSERDVAMRALEMAVNLMRDSKVPVTVESFIQQAQQTHETQEAEK